MYFVDRMEESDILHAQTEGINEEEVDIVAERLLKEDDGLEDSNYSCFSDKINADMLKECRRTIAKNSSVEGVIQSTT